MFSVTDGSTRRYRKAAQLCNCAAVQSASHIGSSVLPQRSGVFASVAVAVDWERRRSGPRRMVMATSAESP